MTIARKTVMISSTARDLPEHRKEVMDACLRQGMFPTMMEHLPANDEEAISVSLKMVDEADIYVGIFAHRYGYMPKGHKISVTEMEYNRAVERKIPRLIFVMDKDHPIKIEDIEMGKGAKKLETFKKKVMTENIVNQFKSPAELRAHVINSLSKYLESTSATIPNTKDSIIDATAYFNALRKRYNVLALEGLTPPQKEEYLQIQLRSVFVEQSVREDTPPVELPKEVWEKLSREQEIHSEDLPSGITIDDVRKARDSYYQKPSQLVLDAVTDTKNKYSIILGDPGSGKSTLSRYVMLSMIDPLLADDKIQKAFEGYLPLLIELRTFAGLSDEGKCETPLEFLEHLGKTEGWSLTQSALHNYLKDDGRAMVIFDGLDEIFDPKLRETITNQIVGFTNEYPKARVIVTSRILGYRRKILSDAGFTHFTLQDLDEKQVEAFITKWYELAMSERPEEAQERSERILKSFADQTSIRQLAGNPMLLTIMAIIGKHQELPRERWKLYDHAASVLIQHWDVNKHLKDERIEADFIGEDDKKELLRRLAFRMQSGGGGLAGNYIHREDLQEEFENYLKERYSKAPDQAKVIAEAMIQQFRERNFILSLYGANVFGFVHRAFLEYFCASAFTWKFEKTKELSIEQLKTDVYGQHWEDQSWHEVLRLICGMIDEKWVGEVIDFLVSQVNQPWPKTFGNKPPWNLVLSVHCLGEARNISAISDSAGRLLSQICTLFDHLVTNEWELDIFTSRNLLPSAQIIGYTWPQRIILADWLWAHSETPTKWTYYLSTIGKFVAAVGIGMEKIYQSIQNLAQDKNGETNSIYITFIEYAIEDGLYRENEHLSLLQNLFSKTLHSEVRAAALNGFSKYFREDAQTLPLLRERAVNDENANVRSSAVSALAEYYRESAQTLPLLRERAVQDENATVRRAAVSALAEHYRENTETLPFLRERAFKDESPKSDDEKKQWQHYVRDTAIEAIAEHWSDHPDTLSLLRERVDNDPTLWLRELCKELINKIERYKSFQ